MRFLPELTLGFVLVSSLLVTVSDIGSAYSFPQQWSRYIRAVERARAATAARADKDHVPIETSAAGGSENTDADSLAGPKKPNFEDFGILGRNGISAGAFLVSPYAVNESGADIQLTLYPSVSVCCVV